MKPNKQNISLCHSCYCMTKTINEKCGKCGGIKPLTELLKAKPNKQKTDWENNFKFFCNKEQTEILVHPTEIIDFISKILQQQREEIIKEIEGIHQSLFEDLENQLQWLLEPGVDKIINQLRQEIRERLKQITNLKEKYGILRTKCRI